MTRVRGEIVGLRRARADFMNNLARGVAAIQTRASAMLTRFHEAHAQMAQESKAERATFVSGLKRSVRKLMKAVGGLRREFASDIKGAHRAWTEKRG